MWDPHSGSNENSVFWDIMPCNLLKVNRRFGGSKNKLSQRKASRNLQSWLPVTISKIYLISRLTRWTSYTPSFWLLFGSIWPESWPEHWLSLSYQWFSSVYPRKCRDRGSSMPLHFLHTSHPICNLPIIQPFGTVKCELNKPKLNSLNSASNRNEYQESSWG
jgi:hypothetical protein